MFRNFMKVKEQQLKGKANQRISWWGSKRWSSVIVVDPPLTEDNPLWERTENDLSNVQFFGYTPEQLQNRIKDYWSKSFWQRCWYRWFSSINQEIEALAYYQQCLTVRFIKNKEEIDLSQSLVIANPTVDLIKEKMVVWLNNEVNQFETYLIYHSSEWLEKQFEKKLTVYEAQLEKKMIKNIQKQIKRLPENNALEINKAIYESYQKMSKQLHDYFELCYQPGYLRLRKTQNSEREHSLISVPHVSEMISICTAPMQQTTNTELSSINVFFWIKSRREQIQTILKREETNALPQIVEILESSFQALVEFMNVQLTGYQTMIDNLWKGDRINGQAALKFTEQLQKHFCKLHRKSSLLFHPDHYVSGMFGQELTLRCHNLITKYNHIFITSLDKFEEGQKQLLDYVNCHRPAGPSTFDFDATCEKIRQGIIQLREERRIALEQLQIEIRKYTENLRQKMEADAKKREQQFRQEMEEKWKVTDTSIKELEMMINQLKQSGTKNLTITDQPDASKQDNDSEQWIFSIFPICEEKEENNKEVKSLSKCDR